jgi:Domain of unknown function (DUF4266)
LNVPVPVHVRRWVAFTALLLAGCSHVRPYQRGQLAHPTMTPDPEGEPAAAHVHDVHEGATGGGALVGSGCGCN